MKWFYDLRISMKLILGFILVAILAGSIGGVGIYSIYTINRDYTEMYENNTIPLDYVEKAAVYYQRTRINLLNMILDPDNMQTYLDRVAEHEGIVTENLEKYKVLISSDVEQKEYDNLIKNMSAYEEIKQRCYDLIRSGRQTEAFALAKGEMTEMAEGINTIIEEIYNVNIAQAASKSEANDKSATQATVLMVGLVAAGMILAILIGLFISRIIANPVRKMMDAADKLAVGDINVNVKADTKDEIGNLMRSFAAMVDNIREQAFTAERIASGDLNLDVKVKSEEDLLGQKLKELVDQNNEVLSNINSASEQVSIGARQVSTSSQALSQGSTEQAGSIEEITASIEQIAAQTKQNADNATNANTFASEAREKAEQGNRRMQEMLVAMAEINDASNNISKIIKVIDEIAFQTNILALNAAVEAARAGQHGKGFAVVAEEVRNLAARSANAAKETTSMIEGTIVKVDAGTKIANETAAALDQIVGGVAKAAELVSDIASASTEQAGGISQINTAINQVAQVVQTNSATSEETAAASEELSGQAELLKEMVGKFKLREKQQYVQRMSGPSLTPEMLKALEEMVAKKQADASFKEPRDSRREHKKAGAIQIDMDDRDFGKYV